MTQAQWLMTLFQQRYTSDTGSNKAYLCHMCWDSQTFASVLTNSLFSNPSTIPIYGLLGFGAAPQAT